MYPLIGDEPHILLIADSIVRDHDVNLINNYAEETPVSMAMGVRLDPNDKGHLIDGISISGIGLPLLLGIPYALGGVFGAKLFHEGHEGHQDSSCALCPSWIIRLADMLNARRQPLYVPRLVHWFVLVAAYIYDSQARGCCARVGGIGDPCVCLRAAFSGGKQSGVFGFGRGDFHPACDQSSSQCVARQIALDHAAMDFEQRASILALALLSLPSAYPCSFTRVGVDYVHVSTRRRVNVDAVFAPCDCRMFLYRSGSVQL
ncbi:MAG: hypothetical protein HY741_06845 [Chloroflexi bacterium]|nr:hypothetical protein [Chloroflexota bacterium]